MRSLNHCEILLYGKFMQLHRSQYTGLHQLRIWRLPYFGVAPPEMLTAIILVALIPVITEELILFFLLYPSGWRISHKITY